MPLKNMNAELKKVVSRVKSAQAQLQNILQDKTWVDQAKKYAERQGEEVKKLINSDVSKLKSFLEREKKELEKLQKQLPGEVEKIKSFVAEQKKELRSLLSTVTQSARTSKKKTKKAGSKGTTGRSKKAKRSKKTGTASTSSS